MRRAGHFGRANSRGVVKDAGMAALYYLSLALEVAIVIIGLRMAFVQKRYSGAAIALSFTLYVVFNLGKTFDLGMSAQLLDGIFFAATLIIFLVVVYLARRRLP